MLKSSQELLHALKRSQPLMVAQLHQFCEINSGTHNFKGLDSMQQALHASFVDIADEIQSHEFLPTETIDMMGNAVAQQCGKALFIRKRPHLKRRVLLSGHMDTVFGIDHPFQSLKYQDENYLIGPGVADMKGGLVVMLHALKAFESTPFSQELGWDVLINADEEIGSPASSAFLNQIAIDSQAALVFEPAVAACGTLAKNRKGSGKFTLVSTGVSAHAGREFNKGRNAICNLSEAILKIHALNGLRDGVTINIGRVAGGEALNVVPNRAVAKLDVRIIHSEDEIWVMDQLKAITKKQNNDYSLKLYGEFTRPVKRINQPTINLFKRIQDVAQEIGLSIDWQNSGGCCDGNNLAAKGLAVIDTLGVRGGKIHSSNEFVLLDSLVERASLSALLLVDLAQGGLEQITNNLKM